MADDTETRDEPELTPLQVQERFEEIGQEMAGMHDEHDGRPFDEADQRRWDELKFERETLEPRVREMVERQQLREEIRKKTNTRIYGLDAPRRTEEVFGKDVTRMSVPEARDWSLRVLDDKEANYPLEAFQGDDLEKRVRRDSELARRIIVTENDHYRAAFTKGVTRAQPVWTAEETQALLTYEQFRAMAEGATTTGGYGIPVFIDPSIILTNQENVNPFLQISRVETVPGNVWKGVSAAGVAWSFDAEAAAVSDDSPTLDQPSVTVYMARGFIPHSIEVAEDYPSFQTEMGRLLGEGYNDLLLSVFSTGSGSMPQGILTAIDATAGSEVTPTTDGAFGAEDVYKVWAALPQKYRANATWMMNVGVNNKIRQAGVYPNSHAYTVNLPQGFADTLMGRPVLENPYFPDFSGTTGAANILIVGDFRNYLIARKSGMSVELVPHLVDVTYNRPTGQRGWFAYGRIGADSVNDAAFRLLQNQ